ncbi:MAG: GAF domain-containing protein [Deltaproteobacteria bacterium]|nr:GAF domain-containing protein [Deltaproteobacteria bacterium]
MEKPKTNYETLIRITKAIPRLHDPKEIVMDIVEAVTNALGVKGCALFLFSPMVHELKLAGSYGLSQEYLDKGPVSSLLSIASSLENGKPEAVYDVTDDPRIQYPEAARKEGIASILSVPILIGEKTLGCMRVYTSEPWEFIMDDMNFVQAVALIAGMALEMCRVNQGYKDSIEILKAMRDTRIFRPRVRTSYEHGPSVFTGHSAPPSGM